MSCFDNQSSKLRSSYFPHHTQPINPLISSERPTTIAAYVRTAASTASHHGHEPRTGIDDSLSQLQMFETLFRNSHVKYIARMPSMAIISGLEMLGNGSLQGLALYLAAARNKWRWTGAYTTMRCSCKIDTPPAEPRNRLRHAVECYYFLPRPALLLINKHTPRKRLKTKEALSIIYVCV